MRWSIVGLVISALFGLIFFISAVFHLATIVYYNVKHGPISPSGGEFEALDTIALTFQNVARALLILVAGLCGCWSAWKWFKQQPREAGILTAVMFVLAGFASAVLTPR